METIIEITAYGETTLIRCDFTQAAAPVTIDYRMGNGWESTPYQCADCSHSSERLSDLGIKLLAEACECTVEQLKNDGVEWEVLETDPETAEDWDRDNDVVATYYTNPSGSDGLIPVYLSIEEWEDRLGRTWYRWVEWDDAGSYETGTPTLDENEAVADAERYAEDQDETPDEDELHARAEEIAKSEWWSVEMSGKDVLRIADEATGHDQGCLMIDPNGSIHWHTGNSVSDGRYAQIDATHDLPAQALHSLAEAISDDSDD